MKTQLRKLLEVENKTLMAISSDVRKIAIGIIGAGALGGMIELDRISSIEAGFIFLAGVVLWLGAIRTLQVALKLEKAEKKVSRRFAHRIKRRDRH
ncbi:hypothetical protein [Motilimonas cestriensis]|uniref:hypothetical protein n=1 Tax=Motilimonas cestriensis TaxID=2742685 RepID=UPI003DA2D59D